MTVVSSKEFATRPARYYNMAVNERIAIKRGKNMFHLTCTNGYQTNGYDEVLEPDEDLRNAITMDELLERTDEGLKDFLEYIKKNRVKSKKPNLAKFFGILPNIGDGLEFQKNARNEWN